MAQKKLAETLAPVIKNALEEGMSQQEIVSEIKEIFLRG
jgi:hypothetical protein